MNMWQSTWKGLKHHWDILSYGMFHQGRELTSILKYLFIFPNGLKLHTKTHQVSKKYLEAKVKYCFSGCSTNTIVFLLFIKIRCYMSVVIYKVSGVTFEVWHETCVACCVSPVTCQLSLTPTLTDKDPQLLTPPLCTTGWFTKTKNLLLDHFWSKVSKSETTHIS